MFSANEGYIDNDQVAKIVYYESAQHDYARSNYKEYLDAINESGDNNYEV